MRVLVIGGAGYIGSHMVKMLIEKDHAVTVFDNLSAGHRDAVHPAAHFVRGDLADTDALLSTLNHGFEGVMHFASFIQVGESVSNPGKYYRNNLTNTFNLLDAMVRTGNANLIFSSTAAIFGNPEYTPIDEKHPSNPINPYGRTKLMVEQALADYDRAHGLRSISLRYFNAAGATPDASLGERHNPETHLIPLILQTAQGRHKHIQIFGDDYDTPDGTCIRDYIHVDDLCSVHLLALEKLVAGGISNAYNLGNGQGFSVSEVVASASLVTGFPIPSLIVGRRLGDPARLVANSERAIRELGWQIKHPKIETIIEDAWRFMCRH
jgi:UDP-glucose 4-epimerase